MIFGDSPSDYEKKPSPLAKAKPKKPKKPKKSKARSKRTKLRIMPDDGRWAWWEEHITDDPIEVKLQDDVYVLRYKLAGTGERRSMACVRFKLEGDSWQE